MLRKPPLKPLTASVAILLVAVVLIVVADNGGKPPASGNARDNVAATQQENGRQEPAQPEKDEAGSETDKAVREEVTDDRPLPADAQIEIDWNKAFAFSTPDLDLKIHLGQLTCTSIASHLAKAGRGNLQTVITKYEQYGIFWPHILPQGEDRGEVLRMSWAFEYINNLKDHLRRDLSLPVGRDNIAEYLDRYKECTLRFKAENTGQNHTFPDHCPVRRLDRHVSLVDADDATHAARYIGPSIACAQALKPFPAAGKIDVSIYFVLPTDKNPVKVNFDGQKAGSEVITIDVVDPN